MTELDVLDRGILELRQLLSKCWRDLASSKLTSYERCELRNQMIVATSELRHCLQAYEAESHRLRGLSIRAKHSPQSVQLRFVDTDYKLAEGVG
jgi:hypothetical protein